MKMFGWCLLVCFLFIAKADSSDNVTNDCVMDLILVIDQSHSLSSHVNGTYSVEKWNLVKGFFQSLVRALDVSCSATNVAAVTYNNASAQTEFRLDVWDTKDEIVYAIGRIESNGAVGRKNIFTGLLQTKLSVLQSRGDRSRKPNVIVIITDALNDTRGVRWVVDEIKGLGASIIGIEVANDVNATAMETVVTAPSSNNYFQVSALENLDSIVDRIAAATCRAARNPPNVTRSTGPDARVCRNDTDCDMDLVFAIDGWKTIASNANGDLSTSKWNLIRTFFKNVGRALNIGPSATRIGYFTFGGIPCIVQHKLSDAQRKAYVVSKLGRMYHSTDRADPFDKLTDFALVWANSLFSPDVGDRPTIPNVLVLFTDYINGSTSLKQEVDKAERFGTSIIGIGFTNATNVTVMETVVTSPFSDNYFAVSGLNDLNSIVDTIAMATCRAAKRRKAAMVPGSLNTNPSRRV